MLWRAASGLVFVHVACVPCTGAGKSTLLATLWRLVPYSGMVAIDGTDICQQSLRTLRSAMAIVPQESVTRLFCLLSPPSLL